MRRLPYWALPRDIHWVTLPPQFEVFNNNVVIGAAIALYVVEFFADKIPYVDTLWDMLHTAIRPIGGALIAVATLGDASPATEGMVALLGGTVAAGSHLTKTSTRAAANASPEPFSNWILSLGEDLFVVGLGFLTLQLPRSGARRRGSAPRPCRGVRGRDRANRAPLVCAHARDRTPLTALALGGEINRRRPPEELSATIRLGRR